MIILGLNCFGPEGQMLPNVCDRLLHPKADRLSQIGHHIAASVQAVRPNVILLALSTIADHDILDDCYHYRLPTDIVGLGIFI
jgi:hypothetical protein